MRRLLGAVLAVGVIGVSLPAVAAADDGTAGPCEAQWVCVEATSPGIPGGGETRSGTSAMTRPAKGVTARLEPCWVQRLSPQPPPWSPLWEGHRPGDGAVYMRVCPHTAGAAFVAAGVFVPGPTFWAATPPPSRTVDPEVLALQAVDRMRLSGPDIQSPAAGRRYLVGMPMWMHAGVSPTTFGPNTASATAGAVTVTATARVTGIRWAMGDGTTVSCPGPGALYKPSYGKRTSPDCGHAYTHTSADQSGSKYTVSATSQWQVDWVGAGQHGQFTMERTSQVRVSVGELQALG